MNCLASSAGDRCDVVTLATMPHLLCEGLKHVEGSGVLRDGKERRLRALALAPRDSAGGRLEAVRKGDLPDTVVDGLDQLGDVVPHPVGGRADRGLRRLLGL